MKKAKTRKNIFSIFSAILGVVFAFTIGFVYCASELNLVYGTKPKSTTAFMENQQYHIINDTVDQPIIFGEGSRNFVIALKYSMPYDFDVRFKYSLEWSGGSSSSNVILNFVNKDNIIFDNEYIFFGESVSKGDGDLTFITGVNFIDTNDETYFGQTLQVKITEVKISRKQTTAYSLADHVLTKDITTTISAQAWINFKNKETSSSNYVIMYNYRSTYASGISYPGLETAYKKPTITQTETNEGVTSTITKVSGASWVGGNKSYAGTGMYVIAGSSDIKFKIEVAGIWRWKTVSQTTGGEEIKDVTVPLISENSIKFNYTDDWTFEKWNDLKLWETRSYDFTIKANTGCYIDILDSIEVTSASRVVTNMYDSYRAVINSIVINPDIVGADNKPITSFEYSEYTAEPIQMKSIGSNPNMGALPDYEKENVTLVNTSSYINGLYSARIGKSAESQTFKTNISLINNTNTVQKMKVNFKLMYHIGNGNTAFVNNLGLRAEEVYQTSKLKAFSKSNLYYAYSLDPTIPVSIDESDPSKVSEIVEGIPSTTVSIAPYSSVAIMESYTVSAKLQNIVKYIFGTDFDVWTYIVAEVSPSTDNETINDSLSSTETNEGYSLGKTNLNIESQLDGSTLSLIVKNNSNKTIKGIYISNFELQEYANAVYELETTEPSDWAASYWKYYYLKNGDYIQYTSNPINDTNPDYPSGSVYKRTRAVINLTSNTTVQNGFTKNAAGNEYSNSTKLLNPGETVVFGTVSVPGSNYIYVSGFAHTNKAKTATSIMLINSGKENAFMVNNTTDSYYVKFSGTLIGTQKNMFAVDGDYNYFIGIVRPGQIISIPMSSGGLLIAVKVEESGTFDVATISTWHTEAKARMEKFFALNKTT